MESTPTQTASLGEVIEASTTTFVAVSARLGEPPSFGSFVRVAPPSPTTPSESDPFEAFTVVSGTVYGLVMEARTSSLEPNRRTVGFGLTEDALRREQPQIWELLATDFTCLIIACAFEGEIRPYLPPRPPRLHAQVALCEEAEVCRITDSFSYLRSIASAADCPNCDELIAASLREAYRCHGHDDEFLVRAGRELALLFRDDYERMAAILRKLK